MLLCLTRSVLLFVLLIAAVRLMGKRQLGEMEPSEFVVALVISDLASVPMQDLGIPLAYGLIPILTILCLEVFLSALSYHFTGVRALLCGHPVILVEHGKLLANHLKKTRLTPDELLEHLREKGVVDLTTVEYAILETNGQISVLVSPAQQPLTWAGARVEPPALQLPVTVISSGKLLPEKLREAGKTRAWVEGILREQHCSMEEVLLMTCSPGGSWYLAKKQEVP